MRKSTKGYKKCGLCATLEKLGGNGYKTIHAPGNHTTIREIVKETDAFLNDIGALKKYNFSIKEIEKMRLWIIKRVIMMRIAAIEHDTNVKDMVWPFINKFGEEVDKILELDEMIGDIFGDI